MNQLLTFVCSILVLFLFDLTLLINGQDQKGFISIPDASRNKIKVLLECGPKMMNIKLFFNRTVLTAFGDWIVVGLNNRIECRQQGNGDLQYVVDIPLINDPCGTKLIESGTFENTVSVKKHPLLILEGDEVITVRCVYGPPEIGSAVIPSLSGGFQGIDLPTVPNGLNPFVSSSVTPVIAAGTIYIIIFLILFLVLLCLLCCCVCFFMKRRKKRMERRKKIFLSVPQSSELNKMGIGHLWWTGKVSCSNDALLSHDYMVSTNSTREHLSISTEYPNDTTPTNSSSSPNDGTFPNQPQIHRETKHMIPRVHIDSGSASNNRAGAKNPTYIPDDQKRPHFKNPSTGRNLRTSENFAYRSADGGLLFNAQPLYAHINANAKNVGQQQDTSPISNPSTLDLDSIERTPKDNRTANETFSPSHSQNALATKSKSQNQSHVPTTLVSADIHINNSGTLYVTHDSMKSLNQKDSDRAKNQANLESDRPKPKVDLDVIIRAIEQNKSNGAKQLNDADLKNLAHLVEEDDKVRDIILHGKSLDDFEAISHMPHFENLYSQEKWAIIVRSLAQVGFTQQLKVAATPNDQCQKEYQHTSASPTTNSQTVSLSPKAESETSSENEMMSPERRVFTRESYYGVKQKVESSDCSSTSADRSTSEIAEPAQFYKTTSLRKDTSNRSSSELLEHAPILNVYLGNVPDRTINVQQYASNGNGNGNNGYYYRDLSGNWDEASIYSTVNNTQVPGNQNSQWQSSSHKM